MKKITNYPSYKENPTHIEGIEKRTRVVGQNDVEEFVNTVTGESELYKKLGRTKEFDVDVAEFRKVFVAGLPVIKELSSPGLKVLTFVLFSLVPKRDEITILMHECSEFTGYSSMTNIYKGIAELLDHNILFRKVGSGGTYFINSNFIYNGSRI